MLQIGRDKGFVLIELIIVLVILGIAIAFILPAFNSLSITIERKTIQRKVINYFEKIRNLAIISNSIVRIKIAGNRLEVNKKILQFQNKGIKEIINSKSKDKFITFYPDGTSSGGRLIFVTDNDKSFGVTVDPVTGSVRVE